MKSTKPDVTAERAEAATVAQPIDAQPAKAPKAPREPKASLPPKATKATKAPKATKATRAPGEPKASKAHAAARPGASGVPAGPASGVPPSPTPGAAPSRTPRIRPSPPAPVPTPGKRPTPTPAASAAGFPTLETHPSPAPERALRSLFLMLARRRGLGRMATRLPLTRAMVARFVAGQTLDEALLTIGRIHEGGFKTTVDVLGELVASPETAAAAAERYVRTLDALAGAGLDRNVSVKLSQMGLGIDADACRANLERILDRAADLGAFLRVDMEDHAKTDATLDLVRSLRPRYPDLGVVIQAALRRSPDDVESLIREGTRVRLCKGAYNEPPSVALTDKAAVDHQYAVLMDRLLRKGAYPAIATHDERLIRRAVGLARREGIGRHAFEFQMLFGVRRDLQERLLADGWTVRVYVPYGTEWYPYFMRRLAERPANVTFVLRSILNEGRSSGPSAARRPG